METLATPENIGRKISKRTNDLITEAIEGHEGIYSPDANLNDWDSGAWVDAIPMIATMIAAIEFETGKKIDSSSLNRLIEAKPFKGKEVVEFGFGSMSGVSAPVTLFMPNFGAKIYGVEPDPSAADSVHAYLSPNTSVLDDDGKLLIQSENLKIGGGEDIPKLFPGKQFDMVISNRVLEEYPMAGLDKSVEEGRAHAESILRRTYESLKENGFSIHVTTMMFLAKKEALEAMGYEVIALNEEFSQSGLGVYYFTILRKSSKS